LECFGYKAWDGSAVDVRRVTQWGGGCGSPGAEATGPRYFYREGVDEDAVLQGVAAGRGLARG